MLRAAGGFICLNGDCFNGDAPLTNEVLMYIHGESETQMNRRHSDQDVFTCHQPGSNARTSLCRNRSSIRKTTPRSLSLRITRPAA